MAIPELLVADVFKTGAQVQVYELVGGSTLNPIGTPIGNDAGEGASATTNDNNVVNRVVEYRGELYMAYMDSTTSLEIQKYNRGTGLWTVAHSYGASDPNSITGLYIANNGSVQRLFLAMRDFGNGRILYTDDGTTWTASGALGTVTALQFNKNPGVMFNNKLYQPTAFNGTQCWEIDPIGLALTLISGYNPGVTTQDYFPQDLVIHDDRLFLLTLDDDLVATPSDWVLFEFTGSGFTLNTQITTGGSWNNNQAVGQGQCCIFKDPNNNNLIALCNGTSSSGVNDNGSTAHKLVPSGASFTPSEITNNLIPTGFRPGARGTTQNALSDRWFCVVVNDTSPTAPEVYIFFAQGPAPGTGYGVYAYTNDSTELSSPAAGPSTAFAIPHQKSGGNDRVNKGSGNQCAIETATPVSGAYRVSYRVYGTVASQTVRLYYSTDQETPNTLATISAQTGGGAVGGGNSVTGVTGDDGVTLFTLDWDLTADGIVNGDSVHMMLDIR
jgi:hypothetical protein